jgi:outer membrane protein
MSPFERRVLVAALFCGAALATRADAFDTSVKVGYAHIEFSPSSGELTGPPGTTPPGVQATVADTRTLAIVAELQIAHGWGLVAQLGTPPVLRFRGAGNGSALGTVGQARAWFPAVLVSWRPAPWGPVHPHVAAGIHHTAFSDAQVAPAYTSAFGGSSTRISLERGLGPVFKVGAEARLGERWSVDLAYARYGIKTEATLVTATPGLGEVGRRVALRADPDVVSLMIGYRF